jgi:RsiW-degrading membrane proteinase PrsW (M82 family)
MNMQNERLEIKPPSPTIVYGVLVAMAGLSLPIILIPMVWLTGYSEIVEEIIKALVVLFLILRLPDHKTQILAGMSFGLLFGLSENFLYLNQIFQLGDFGMFWQRILWTMPMHIITTLVILFSGLAGKRFLVVGLVGAIILHALFNGLAVEFLMASRT